MKFQNQEIAQSLFLNHVRAWTVCVEFILLSHHVSPDGKKIRSSVTFNFIFHEQFGNFASDSRKSCTKWASVLSMFLLTSVWKVPSSHFMLCSERIGANLETTSGKEECAGAVLVPHAEGFKERTRGWSGLAGVEMAVLSPAPTQTILVSLKPPQNSWSRGLHVKLFHTRNKWCQPHS